MPIPLQNVIIITTSMRTMFHTNLNMNLSEQISAPVDTIHLKQLLPQSIQVLFLHSLPNAPHRCVQCGIHRRSDPRFHFRQKSQGFGTKWIASRFPARLPLVINEIEQKNLLLSHCEEKRKRRQKKTCHVLAGWPQLASTATCSQKYAGVREYAGCSSRFKCETFISKQSMALSTTLTSFLAT